MLNLFIVHRFYLPPHDVTRLPFSWRPTTHAILLLWPWPWPDDLHIRTWSASPADRKRTS